MNEDDTFKRLKGLTRDEAEEIFKQVLASLTDEMDAQNQYSSAGVSIAKIRECADPLLKPYGWSCEKLFPLSSTDFS